MNQMARSGVAALVGALVLAGPTMVGSMVIGRSPPERKWTAEQDRTPTATINADGSITIHNVRDWTYGRGVVTSRAWRDETIDPRKVVRAWFLSEPFSEWKAIGHTFLSFEFKDGPALSFSIEARMKAGQPYSPWRGALRSYPLAYQWGTERDFVERRVLYLGHPLRLYPLTIPPKTAQALFRDLVEETNALDLKPRLYNTLTDNYTNTLAYIVNRHAPRTLPWSPAWYFPGYADEYLMKQDFIALDGGSIEGTRAVHDLAAHRAATKTSARDPPSSFSAALRAIAAGLPAHTDQRTSGAQ